MNMQQTLEQISSANPVPVLDSLPEGAWSAAALLADIERRSTTMTDTTTRQAESSAEKRPWGRGPLVAVAVAVVIVLAGIVALLATPDDDIEPAESPDAASTPAEVATAYLEAYDSGDFETYEALLDPDQGALFAGLNGNRRSATYQALTGMVSVHECSSSDSTVTCVTTRTSGIAPGTSYEPYTTTFTVEEGLITDLETDRNYAWTFNQDLAAFEEYRRWVSDQRPDAYDGLFASDATARSDTPEVFAAHREMIAEFQSATGG